MRHIKMNQLPIQKTCFIVKDSINKMITPNLK